ncbi:MAG: hypothetical protein NZ953_02535 [Thaumarchaeota archaeon]|nr:hypothetical protein [Candidatus Calditenuaceae archaeon]MCX8203324.1 hypothetical protein [Nitrososphaeria archaeon]MDW8042710.1 hypothetical protein [Nitrososphaerota archaeon]
MNGARLGLVLSLAGIALSLGPVLSGAMLFHAGLHGLYELLIVGNASTLQVPLSLFLSLLAAPLTLVGLREFRKGVRENGG